MELVVTICIAAVGFVLSLLASAVSFGITKQKVEEGGKRNDDQDCVIKELATKIEVQAVVIRANEDRERNDKRIEELYNSRNQHANLMATIGAQMQNLADAIAGLKTDFKEGFAELKNDIRDIKKTT